MDSIPYQDINAGHVGGPTRRRPSLRTLASVAVATSVLTVLCMTAWTHYKKGVRFTGRWNGSIPSFSRLAPAPYYGPTVRRNPASYYSAPESNIWLPSPYHGPSVSHNRVPVPPSTRHDIMRFNGHPVNPCEEALFTCDFYFEGLLHSFPMFIIEKDPANQPFTPRILSKVHGEYPGILNTNNIPVEVITYFGAVNITLFGDPPFSPTVFKPFPVGGTKGSGVGHETFQGNQLQEVWGKCLRLYFTDYQLLESPNGNLIGNKNNVPKSENKCVVFVAWFWA